MIFTKFTQWSWSNWDLPHLVVKLFAVK